MERKRERERKTARDRNRETERDRERQTETDRDRQRQTETDRDRQRQTETDRDRQRKLKRERNIGNERGKEILIHIIKDFENEERAVGKVILPVGGIVIQAIIVLDNT